MNLNELLVQQQRALEQMNQQNQILMWVLGIINLLLLAAIIWVVYKFYYQLRAIATELKNFRVAFEASQNPAAAIAATRKPLASRSAEIHDDSRYMPKQR